VPECVCPIFSVVSTPNALPIAHCHVHQLYSTISVIFHSAVHISLNPNSSTESDVKPVRRCVLRHAGSPISSFRKHTASILTAIPQNCLLWPICRNVRHEPPPDVPSHPSGPPTHPSNCANLTLHISSALPKLIQTSRSSPCNAHNTHRRSLPTHDVTPRSSQILCAW